MPVINDIVAGQVFSTITKPNIHPPFAVGKNQESNSRFLPSGRLVQTKAGVDPASLQQEGPGEMKCRCGNCQACAAQAYNAQANMLSSGQPTTEQPSQTTLPVESAAEDPPQQLSQGQKGANGDSLSREELAQLTELKKRDRVVRAHEQAHMTAAAGIITKGMSFSYQQGADGRRYAVGGEVQIDAGKEAAPAETIAKMKKVRAAALAPADPSAQDRRVAASAMTKMSQARVELRVEQTEETKKQREDIAGDSEEGKDDSVSETGAEVDKASTGSFDDKTTVAAAIKTPRQHINITEYSRPRNTNLTPSQFHVQA